MGRVTGWDGNWELPLFQKLPLCPGCSAVESGSPEHSSQESQVVDITIGEARFESLLWGFWEPQSDPRKPGAGWSQHSDAAEHSRRQKPRMGVFFFSPRGKLGYPEVSCGPHKWGACQHSGSV